MEKIRIAAAQMDLAWEKREDNYRLTRDFAAEAKKAGADLLILPEMFAFGFSYNTAVTVESPEGPTTEFLGSLAREFGLGVLGGAVIQTSPDPPQNVALVFDDQGRRLAGYAKIKLFSLSGEDKVHAAGSKPVVFSLNSLKASCFICYDLRFPELFREVADEVTLIIVIASWPEMRQLHWDILLPARAVENQVYVVGVNRVGEGGGISYTGGSVIIDPLGEVLAHAGEKAGLITAEISPTKVSEIREKFPFLKDR